MQPVMNMSIATIMKLVVIEANSNNVVTFKVAYDAWSFNGIVVLLVYYLSS